MPRGRLKEERAPKTPAIDRKLTVQDLKFFCLNCGTCCCPFSIACIILLTVLCVVLEFGAHDSLGIHEEEEAELAVVNIKTAMQLYGVCVGLSFLCVMTDWCTRKKSFKGEKQPLLKSKIIVSPGTPGTRKGYNQGL